MRRLDRIMASCWKWLRHPNKLWSKHAGLCATTVGPDYSATGITLERYKTRWLSRAWLALSDFRADVSPATKGNTEKKKCFELKRKKKMNKSNSLWVRETLKNTPFPRRRRWESLDCTHFQNMLKMKHWRFVEIRIPASCCDSRRKERSASRFDPALQIQPRFSFFFFS